MSEWSKIVEKMSEGGKISAKLSGGQKKKEMSEEGKKILFCDWGGNENTRF